MVLLTALAAWSLNSPEAFFAWICALILAAAAAAAELAALLSGFGESSADLSTGLRLLRLSLRPDGDRDRRSNLEERGVGSAWSKRERFRGASSDILAIRRVRLLC